MIEKQIKSYLPFDAKSSIPYLDFIKLEANDRNQYLLVCVSKKEYSTYVDLIRASKKISKAIYEISFPDGIILIFLYDALTEVAVRKVKCFELFSQLFEATSYEITLKKEHMVHLNHIYKVLDNKFSYMELRIREVETNPYKNDVSWVLLSKYHAILDAKIYLYDLQTDIFKTIDKKIIVKYGMIYKKMNEFMYQKGFLLPSFDLYNGPIGMLYARYYLSIDKIPVEVIQKLDSFNQKYFCFMVLYILILNLNLETMLTNYSVASYLQITKKIKDFIGTYKVILEG